MPSRVLRTTSIGVAAVLVQLAGSAGAAEAAASRALPSATAATVSTVTAAASTAAAMPVADIACFTRCSPRAAHYGDAQPPFGQRTLSRRAAGRSVLIAGDSWAYHMANGMLAVAPPSDTILDAGGGGCGIMLPTTPGTPQSCQDWQTAWPALMSRDRPDAVILEISEWDITPQQITPGGPLLNLTDLGYRQRFIEHLDQAVRILSADGTPLYLETSKMVGDPNYGAYASIMNEVLREFAAQRPHVHLLDVRGQLCDDDGCPKVLDGVTVYDVTGHPTAAADGRLAIWALNTMFS